MTHHKAQGSNHCA